MSRKIIQIATEQENEFIEGSLIVLCDDGTVWCFSRGEWRLHKKQIPQGNICGEFDCDVDHTTFDSDHEDDSWIFDGSGMVGDD